MGSWQRMMIGLARNERVVAAVQSRSALAGLAGRFVAGPDVHAAVSAAQRLREDAVDATVFYLGEYVRDPSAVARCVEELRQVTTALAAAQLDVHLSIDPTQAGLMTSAEVCEANVRQVAEAVVAAAPGRARDRRVLMIDMEDSSATDTTLGLHDRLRREDLPVAVTVQAYLHRTGADLARLAESGSWVRLVKGALAEPSAVAATRRAEIDLRYRQHLATLFSPQARDAGCRPSVATHDLRLVVEAVRLARSHGWSREAFEFEMLHGVRPDVQRELARRGYRVRAYLPFGTDWFAYSIRRVGENPRNARFTAAAIGHSLLPSGGSGGHAC